MLRALFGFGLVPALAGIAAGLCVAATLLRIGRTFVYDLPVLEPGLVVTTVLILLAIVTATVLPHALRSVRINPIAVLRD